jgi:hypothetical protein
MARRQNDAVARDARNLPMTGAGGFARHNAAQWRLRKESTMRPREGCDRWRPPREDRVADIVRRLTPPPAAASGGMNAHLQSSILGGGAGGARGRGNGCMCRCLERGRRTQRCHERSNDSHLFVWTFPTTRMKSVHEYVIQIVCHLLQLPTHGGVYRDRGVAIQEERCRRDRRRLCRIFAELIAQPIIPTADSYEEENFS